MNKKLDTNKYKSIVPETTAIFQIMIDRPSSTQAGNRDYTLLGSGFFISKYGVFVTAKHVFEDMIEDQPKAKPAHDYQNGKGLVGLVVYSGNAFPCPIHSIEMHPTADVAIGILATPAKGKNVPPFAISYCSVAKNRASNKDEILVYGYQRSEVENDKNDPETVNINLNPKYYDGTVENYHQNGFTIAKWPVYELLLPIASGVSGSPILDKTTNNVIGVACAGWSTKDEDVPHGTATDIHTCFDLPVPKQLQATTGTNTIGELLKYENHLR